MTEQEAKIMLQNGPINVLFTLPDGRTIPVKLTACSVGLATIQFENGSQRHVPPSTIKATA
jgi:hypothetical protein